MFKNFCYGIAILGIPLSMISLSVNANYVQCTKLKNYSNTGISSMACDVSFTAAPTFGSMCVLGFQRGIYTITNNSPIPLAVNNIHLINNDGGPTSYASIVTSTPAANDCSASPTLASSASCNIQVNLTPGALSTYNRTLQIGIGSRQFTLNSAPITAAVNCGATPPSGVPAGYTIPITCTILGNSTVTNVISAGTAVNGDVCTSTGTSITGFPPGTLTGVQRLNDGTAIAQKADSNTTFLAKQGLACNTILTGSDLGSLAPLTSGVYCFASSAQLTGALTLTGGGTFVFKIGSTLTTASASQVLLTGGTTRDNVFWIVGSSATLGTGTRFQGNLLAQTSITLNTNAILQGRAFVRDAAITLDANPVNPDPAQP